MRNHLVLALSILLISCASYNALGQKTPKGDRILGTYEAVSEETNNVSHIKIIKASNGKYYGEIIWLKDSKYPDGSDKVDKLNPDEKLRSHKLIGLRLLKDFVYDISNDEWNDGTIYNPATGKTYKSFIKFEGPEKLYIRGFIGSSWMGLGKTVYWNRIKNK